MGAVQRTPCRLRRSPCCPSASARLTQRPATAPPRPAAGTRARDWIEHSPFERPALQYCTGHTKTEKQPMQRSRPASIPRQSTYYTAGSPHVPNRSPYPRRRYHAGYSSTPRHSTSLLFLSLDAHIYSIVHVYVHTVHACAHTRTSHKTRAHLLRTAQPHRPHHRFRHRLALHAVRSGTPASRTP